jgi:hypothetical protein
VRPRDWTGRLGVVSCMTPQGNTVEAALNRLVREGVITAFELPVVSNAVALHIIVTTPLATNNRTPGYDRELFEAVRRRVAREVESHTSGREVMVSVRSALT